MEPNEETVTLWGPVGPVELRLIAESGYRAFPPRLPSSRSSTPC